MNHPVKYQPEKVTFSKVLNYFFKGLLVLAPIALTLYIIIFALNWLDGLIPAINIPGLGLIIVLGTITVVGYLTSTIVIKGVFEYFERGILKIPFISLIYSSLKELIGAFVGEQKKFNKPVIVAMDPENGIRRLGFITQDNLSNLGLEDMVGVYLPHSYNFSGNFYVVPRSSVKRIDVSRTHFMKFIVSGGATAIPEAAFDRKN
ncbi:DUF502 domain-containing protein [Fulvivirgaceae bacterium BMA12]|uniref:DUF502 domain-containing protein n=1 Tax=Agaribacillus aureus TaxID=3051825 RepID=A0ABT8L421_9BACT|nr:DUF502 domain-containing protein [Fulvivirgaceae bacterium BMA12]